MASAGIGISEMVKGNLGVWPAPRALNWELTTSIRLSTLAMVVGKANEASRKLSTMAPRERSEFIRTRTMASLVWVRVTMYKVLPSSTCRRHPAMRRQGPPRSPVGWLSQCGRASGLWNGPPRCRLHPGSPQYVSGEGSGSVLNGSPSEIQPTFDITWLGSSSTILNKIGRRESVM